MVPANGKANRVDICFAPISLRCPGRVFRRVGLDVHLADEQTSGQQHPIAIHLAFDVPALDRVQDFLRRDLDHGCIDSAGRRTLCGNHQTHPSHIMAEFFRGWKRKVGAVTLGQACVFGLGWIRSQTLADRIGSDNKVWLPRTRHSELLPPRRDA